MSKAGRPSVPAQIKELSGTIRKDRQREGVEFAQITEVPKPEVWLDPKAKKYFKSICELLIGKSLLTNANVPLVLLMAQEFSTYEMACRELADKSNYVKITATGYEQQSPWVSIRNQAGKNYRDIAALFGLDPISSQKIGSPTKGEKDPFDELSKKYNDDK
jgi:P27 family predicted phage terminase small subunit